MKSWHNIATYSNGYSNHGSVYDLTIKGDKVRIKYTGTPVKDNIGAASQLHVVAVKYIEAEGAITEAGQGELNWGYDELKSKTDSFEFTTTSRKIQLQIAPCQLEKWKVNVYNYY